MRASTANTSPGIQSSDRLGDYELVRRIAVGGMAELYLARRRGAEGFERLFALKRIHPQHAINSEFVEMFLDEARLAARFHHANLPQVYELGHDGGHYFYTMEYISGRNLRQLAKLLARTGQTLPIPHAISIVLGAAAGLHYVHESGDPVEVVHRDVSPSNILVSYDGTVKVVDFGLAKILRERSSARSGLLKGKVGYMSPEQARGGPVDRRSDIYSLGVLLYELTTGKRLHGDLKNEYEVLERTAAGDFRKPSERCPDYPVELERIVLGAMALDPGERYPTARALSAALEQFAYRQHIALSTAALGEYMRQLFRPGATAAGANLDQVEHAPPPADSSSEISRSVEGTSVSTWVRVNRRRTRRFSTAVQPHRASSKSRRRWPRTAKIVGATALAIVAIAIGGALGLWLYEQWAPSVTQLLR